MRAEAAQLGIRVSVLCPGVIRTPILDAGGKYGKMLMDIPPEKQSRMWKKMRPMPADVFAGKALRSIAGNKAIIVVPSRWKILWLVNRLFPSVGIKLAGKSFQDLQKKPGNG
jgi:short-subunit dehydrogenase